jgi:3-phosphoshikimate 1-carboxyvinyltransferase
MSTFVATPAKSGVRGHLSVPGDKSVSHRALLLSAMAAGRSSIEGLSAGRDVMATVKAIEAFGAAVSRDREGRLVVEGGRLHEPSGVIDVGNSGTAMRLLAGWATGIDGLTVLTGDESVSARPMGRVIEPLTRMGAQIDSRQGATLPPLVVRGGGLHGIDYTLAVPSAQVKGAVLLAGLSAEGETIVRESAVTRRHTEEMLLECGAAVVVSEGAVSVRAGRPEPHSWRVPGDPSQAAFWLVAACITPGSDLTVQHVYVGPARAVFLDVLERMGADLERFDEDPSASTASIRARSSSLKGTDVSGSEIPGLIDEIPVLAVAAAFAEGTTSFADAAELRVKESDRITTTVRALHDVGVEAEERPDGLLVHGTGGRPLRGGAVDSSGDHRIAMALAVSAMASSASVTIDGWDSVGTSYPGFEQEYGQCAS